MTRADLPRLARRMALLLELNTDIDGKLHPMSYSDLAYGLGLESLQDQRRALRMVAHYARAELRLHPILPVPKVGYIWEPDSEKQAPFYRALDKHSLSQLADITAHRRTYTPANQGEM